MCSRSTRHCAELPPGPTVTASGNARAGVRRRRWLTVLAAMVAATATWVVAVPLLGIDLVVSPAGGAEQTVGPMAVMLTGVLAGLAAWLLLALLEKWTTRAGLVWRVVAALVLMVSLVGPLSAGSGPATAVLLVLHLLVGGILIGGLPRRRIGGPTPST